MNAQRIWYLVASTVDVMIDDQKDNIFLLYRTKTALQFSEKIVGI
jgi:hypothetical protein